MSKLAQILVAVLSFTSCANGTRDNPVDPANAPAIEMNEPVLQDGAVVISWRYFDDGSSASQFVVRKIASASGDRFPVLAAFELDAEAGTGPQVESVDQGVTTVGRIPLTNGESDWQTVSVRDTSIIAGVRLLYQVSAVSASGDLLAGVTRSFRLD